MRIKLRFKKRKKKKEVREQLYLTDKGECFKENLKAASLN